MHIICIYETNEAIRMQSWPYFKIYIIYVSDYALIIPNNGNPGMSNIIHL